jgi:hypothetical protein
LLLNVENLYNKPSVVSVNVGGTGLPRVGSSGWRTPPLLRMMKLISDIFKPGEEESGETKVYVRERHK